MPDFAIVLAVNAGVILALFVLAWAICVAMKDVTPVDSLWGLGMGVVAVSTFIQTGGDTQRGIVMTAIAVAWSLRLGGYMLWRWRDHGPDGRYVRVLDKAKAEIDMQKGQMDLQMKQEEIGLKREEMAANAEMKQMEMGMKAQEMQQKQQLTAQDMAMQMQAKQAEHSMGMQHAQMKHQMGMQQTVEQAKAKAQAMKMMPKREAKK